MLATGVPEGFSWEHKVEPQLLMTLEVLVVTVVLVWSSVRVGVVVLELDGTGTPHSTRS